MKGVAGLPNHTGDVVTHLARNAACLEIGGARGHGIQQPGELEGVVGAGFDAEPAAHAGTKEVGLPQSRRRPQSLGGHRLHLLACHRAQTHTQEAHGAGPLGKVGQELATAATHPPARLTPS